MRLIDADALSEHKFVGNKFTQIGGRRNGKMLEAVNQVYQQGWNDAIDAIVDNAPTVDDNEYNRGFMHAMIMVGKEVEERPQGEWKITDSYPHRVYCNKCFKTYAQENWEVWKEGSLPRNFCPNCGADMRREEEE